MVALGQLDVGVTAMKVERFQRLQGATQILALVVGLGSCSFSMARPAMGQTMTEFPTGEVMKSLGDAHEIGAFLTRRLPDPLPNTLMRGGAIVTGTFGTYIESAEKYPEIEHRVLRTLFVEGTSTVAGGIAVAVSGLCGPAAPGCAVVGGYAVREATGEVAEMIYDTNSTTVINSIRDARGIHSRAVTLALPEALRGNNMGTSAAYSNREAAAREKQRQDEARRREEAERRFAEEQQRLVDQQRKAQTTLMDSFASGFAQGVAGAFLQGSNGGSPQYNQDASVGETSNPPIGCQNSGSTSAIELCPIVIPPN